MLQPKKLVVGGQGRGVERPSMSYISRWHSGTEAGPVTFKEFLSCHRLHLFCGSSTLWSWLVNVRSTRPSATTKTRASSGPSYSPCPEAHPLPRLLDLQTHRWLCKQFFFYLRQGSKAHLQNDFIDLWKNRLKLNEVKLVIKYALGVKSSSQVARWIR